MAFIDIFQNNRNGVGSESLSSWTQSLVFSGVGQGAAFAWVAPSTSQGATARCSCDPNSNLRTASQAGVTSRQSFQVAISNPCIDAAHPSGVQLEVLWAVAQVASWGVHTQSIDTVHRVSALIHISTIASTSVQFITIIADAAEHPGQVLTGTEDANVLEGALINILTSLAVLSRGESHLTFTAVTPGGI